MRNLINYSSINNITFIRNISSLFKIKGFMIETLLSDKLDYDSELL
jgi:hypothetical protein